MVGGEAHFEIVLRERGPDGRLRENGRRALRVKSDVDRRVGRTLQQAIMQEFLEHFLVAAVGDEHLGVGVGGRLPGHARQQFDLGYAVEERHDHRLDRHDRAVDRAGVAPGLEIVRRADMHAGQGRGLVGVIAVADDLRHRLHQRTEIEVGRRVVGGVAAEHEEGLDRAGLQRGGKGLDGRGAGGLHGHKVDRRTEIAELRVHRVSEHVDRDGLVRPGDHEAGAGVLPQVLGALRNPVRVDLQSLGQRCEIFRPEHLVRHGGREGEHLAAGDAQAVVGHAAGKRETALGDIQAVHLVFLLRDAAALGEFAGVVERAGLGVEEVGVEREDALGLRETVDRLHVLAERGLRGRNRRLVLHRLVLGPDGARENLLQLRDEARAGRRGGFVGEERQAFATAGVGPVDFRQQLVHPVVGQRVAALRVAGGTLRIVEIKDRGLGEQ